MTLEGGTAGLGTIFKMNADGTGFAVIHSFSAASGDGWQPAGSLTLVGSTLFGMTRFGGAGAGSIFRINTDGTGYSQVYSFAGSPGDGANPLGTLLLAGSTLYGTTPNGGADGLGTIFDIQADGSGYDLLYSFTGGSGDGANPNDLLLWREFTGRPRRAGRTISAPSSAFRLPCRSRRRWPSWQRRGRSP